MESIFAKTNKYLKIVLLNNKEFYFYLITENALVQNFINFYEYRDSEYLKLI